MLQRRFIINAIRTKRIFIQKMNKYTYQQQQQHMKNISTRILGNNYVMNSNSNKNNYHYYNYHTTKAVFDKCTKATRYPSSQPNLVHVVREHFYSKYLLNLN